MADWSLPSLTDTYTNFLQYISNRLADAARWFDTRDTAATNIVTRTKRWNASAYKWEEWNGTAWVDMASLYGISISGNAATATTASSCSGNAATATSASAVAWANVSGKPTTVSGFGITDMTSQSVNYAATSGAISGNAIGDSTKDVGYAQNLRWRGSGNGYAIIDNSGGNYTADKTNSANVWQATYPVLMGWNGTTTYGVRVDSARRADSAASADTAAACSGNAATATTATTCSGNAATATNATTHIAATGAVHGATSANTVSAIVQRDASGNFSAGTITASLTGNCSGNAATATNATNHIADATGSAHGATNANTANMIVKRDASGNFSAGTITASLNGNAATATNASQLGGLPSSSFASAVACYVQRYGISGYDPNTGLARNGLSDCENIVYRTGGYGTTYTDSYYNYYNYNNFAQYGNN